MLPYLEGERRQGPLASKWSLAQKWRQQKPQGPASFYNVGRGGHKKAAILDFALRSTMAMIRDPERESLGVAVTSSPLAGN